MDIPALRIKLSSGIPSASVIRASASSSLIVSAYPTAVSLFIISSLKHSPVSLYASSTQAAYDSSSSVSVKLPFLSPSGVKLRRTSALIPSVFDLTHSASISAPSTSLSHTDALAATLSVISILREYSPSKDLSIFTRGIVSARIRVTAAARAANTTVVMIRLIFRRLRLSCFLNICCSFMITV